MHVLLVDDDPEFRDTLRHLLTDRGEALVVGEAGDGEEALSLAGALHPDVVLMDLGMPRMNGVEATRQLKARWPEVAVIIITVHDDEVYRRTALAAGAEAFLVKKTLGVDLWPTLERVTEKAQGGRASQAPPSRGSSP
jgi:DNA-binding NarL/FixJ family response regulator